MSDPITFDMPALGRTSVLLGDVYDATKGEFLGISLFEDVTDDDQMSISVGHTDLKLSMSNTFEDKASTMNLSASLALEVLGGLVRIEGSGSYLHDSKANAEQHCWAMSLFKRLVEKRLLFEEKTVLNKITPRIVHEIQKYKPTHFVSSIVYGGSVIINLLARRVEIEEVEEIKGELSVELQKLKGLVDLSGKGHVEIEGKLKDLNDKFDLKMYGDIPAVALTDLQSILDFLPEAANAIGDGVPIKFTLQPIPQDVIEEQTRIYELEDDVIKNTLQVFSQLNDIKARFDAIYDSTQASRTIIPSLARTIESARSTLRNKYNSFQAQLGKFLTNYYEGVVPNPIDREELVTEVIELVREHLTREKDVTPKLVELEQAFHDFEDFRHAARLAGFTITSLEDIGDKIILLEPDTIVALTLVPPLVDPVDIDAFSRISILLRVARASYSELGLDQYLCYVENETGRDKLQDAIEVEDTLFDTFTSTITIRLTKGDIGASFQQDLFDDLDIVLPQPIFRHEPSMEIFGDFKDKQPGVVTDYKLSNFRCRGSFTVLIDAEFQKAQPSSDAVVARITSGSGDNPPGYSFMVSPAKQISLDFKRDSSTSPVKALTQPNGHWLEESKPYSIAFVQNVTKDKGTWTLYVNGVVEDTCAMTPCEDLEQPFVFNRPGIQTIPYQAFGTFYRLRVFQKALTQEEIEKIAFNKSKYRARGLKSH